MRKLLLAPLLLALLHLGSPALADGEINRLITAPDRARLDGFERARSQAAAQAAAADPTAWRTVSAELDRPKLSFNDWDMTGEWRCRVTKLGGPAPVVTYDWFRCRVTDDGSGWRLEKLSGSQRTAGRFFTDGEDRLIYLGSQYVAGEAAPRYGAGPRSDQVGYAFRAGRSVWRIEFPAPAVESKFDIIEFSR